MESTHSTPVRFRLALLGGALSPYRLLERNGKEIVEVNDFLDALFARGLSPRTLRGYGYSLLNFWRWLTEQKVDPYQLHEADLVSYIQFQHRAKRKAAPRTINHRLSVARAFYRYHTGQDIPLGRRVPKSHPLRFGKGGLEFGFFHPPRPRARPLWVKVPRRTVVPLSKEEVRAFLESLRTWRDLAIVAVMLFCGLRSREVLLLTLNDLHLPEGEIRVRGKGNKDRVLPLCAQVASCLRTYLATERPKTRNRQLFVCLKGRHRGRAMTTAGLRSLFRYHRKRSSVAKANPHRFRHTFGSDMARAGLSMPALMHLMGHATIKTTLLYVELAPQDVWEEFHRVVAKLKRDSLRLKSHD